MEPVIEQAKAIAPAMPMAQNVFSKDDFNKKYWFNTLQMVTVINPLTYDWPFMVEMRHFIVKAGSHESFPGVIANVYLDQMSKILAQDDDKLGFMADPALKKLYYDKLIVSVESLVHEHDNTPAYLKDVSQSARLNAPDETPPWERASEVSPPTPPPAPLEPTPEIKPDVPIEGTKSFELNGLTFRQVTDKAGKTTFFKNDIEIDEADYARAASMI
jgi:hypothetical protein